MTVHYNYNENQFYMHRFKYNNLYYVKSLTLVIDQTISAEEYLIDTNTVTSSIN